MVAIKTKIFFNLKIFPFSLVIENERDKSSYPAVKCLEFIGYVGIEPRSIRRIQHEKPKHKNAQKYNLKYERPIFSEYNRTYSNSIGIILKSNRKFFYNPKLGRYVTTA